MGSSAQAWPPFNNGLHGVPSHWIQLYGTAHGMFYDPITKLFFDDGPPRTSLLRSPDGGLPCQVDPMAQFAALEEDPGDAIHMTSKPLMAQFATVTTEAVPKMYCRCTGNWVEEAHECLPVVVAPHPGQMILPRGTCFLPQWITHSNTASDASYIHRLPKELLGGATSAGMGSHAQLAQHTASEGLFLQSSPRYTGQQNSISRLRSASMASLNGPLSPFLRRNTIQSYEGNHTPHKPTKQKNTFRNPKNGQYRGSHQSKPARSIGTGGRSATWSTGTADVNSQGPGEHRAQYVSYAQTLRASSQR